MNAVHVVILDDLSRTVYDKLLHRRNTGIEVVVIVVLDYPLRVLLGRAGIRDCVPFVLAVNRNAVWVDPRVQLQTALVRCGYPVAEDVKAAVRCLTGLDYEPGKVGSGCLSADGGTISLHERIAQYYPGTGDLFAAVVLGALLNGRALADACALAGEFVKDCIAYTAAQHTDPMHGVQFEKLLPRLFSCHENQAEV